MRVLGVNVDSAKWSANAGDGNGRPGPVQGIQQSLSEDDRWMSAERTGQTTFGEDVTEAWILQESQGKLVTSVYMKEGGGVKSWRLVILAMESCNMIAAAPGNPGNLLEFCQSSSKNFFWWTNIFVIVSTSQKAPYGCFCVKLFNAACPMYFYLSGVATWAESHDFR